MLSYSQSPIGNDPQKTLIPNNQVAEIVSWLIQNWLHLLVLK